MKNKNYLTVAERIKKEYQDFKNNMLQKTNTEIYNSFYKIRCYEDIYNFIVNSEEEIEKLIQDKTLAELYSIYLDMEDIDIGRYEKVKEFLEIEFEKIKNLKKLYQTMSDNIELNEYSHLMFGKT